MRFVVACHGTRGDVEPCAAVGCELLRRGHDVCMAVPPDLVGFVESAGLAAVAYGPDSRQALKTNFVANAWKDLPRNFWRIGYLIRLWRDVLGSPDPSARGNELWPYRCRLAAPPLLRNSRSGASVSTAR